MADDLLLLRGSDYLLLRGTDRLILRAGAGGDVEGATSDAVELADSYAALASLQADTADAAELDDNYAALTSLQADATVHVELADSYSSVLDAVATTGGIVLDSDSLNRGDSDSLGSTDGALGGAGGTAWTEHQGDTDIASNKARTMGFDPGTYGWLATFDPPSATGDDDITAVIELANNSVGMVAVRADSPVTGFIAAGVIISGISDLFLIRKWNGSAFVPLAVVDAAPLPLDTPMTVRIRLHGTRIDAWLDGANQITAFDSTNLNETRIGLHGDSVAGVQMDSISITGAPADVIDFSDSYAGLLAGLAAATDAVGLGDAYTAVVTGDLAGVTLDAVDLGDAYTCQVALLAATEDAISLADSYAVLVGLRSSITAAIAHADAYAAQLAAQSSTAVSVGLGDSYSAVVGGLPGSLIGALTFAKSRATAVFGKASATATLEF